MPRFAANLSMLFTEQPFLDRFSAAAVAGFTACEFLFPYDHQASVVAERIAAAGLNLVLFNLPPGDWTAGERGLAALPQRRDDFLASLGQAMAYARILKPRILHMMAGLADPADGGARACYRDNLARAADAAGEIGLTLCIEPINRRDMPGYFLSDFQLAADVIADLGRPNIALQFDIYHRQVIAGDVLTGLSDLLPLIGHVQIAAVPTRNEPGSGELDDFWLFAELDRLGYRGHVGCEYRPANGTLAGLGWLAEARRRSLVL